MPNFAEMMKQAAQLQSKMQALQVELDTVTVEGTAGGGMVTVTLTAKGDLRRGRTARRRRSGRKGENRCRAPCRGRRDWGWAKEPSRCPPPSPDPRSSAS